MAAEIEAELVTPPFPMALSYVWEAWARIRRRKASGVNGPSPIEWPDIDAFIRRTGIRLDPHDVRLIEALDDIYLTPQEPSVSEKRQALKDGLIAIAKPKPER